MSDKTIEVPHSCTTGVKSFTRPHAVANVALASVLIIIACSSCDSKDPEPARSTGPDGVSHIQKESSYNPEAHDQWPESRFASEGVIQQTPQRRGDPVAGRRSLLEEAYVSCGLPERVFRELLDQNSVVEVEGRTERASGLPFNVNVVTDEQGTNVVVNNCLTCHGTVLFDQLQLGLGNEFMDFTGNASVLAERAGALVNGAVETQVWERYADRIAAIAPYIQTQTVGVNPANNLTFALIAHRNPDTNAWSDEPLLAVPPFDPPPVSVPPWWRMAKKPAMFNLGEGRGDHARIMMSASMLCTDTLEELEKIDAYAPDIRAFIASIEAPVWPFEVDLSLVAAGESVFKENCSQCHGSYGDNPVYPARLVPIDIVQTDDTLVSFAHNDGVRYNDWFNRSYYADLSTIAPGAGYVAPPLDGVWATGPFLHNGSVPSIKAVLDSPSRPRYWHHIAKDATNKAEYNQSELGWNYEILESFDESAEFAKRVYNTDKPGYSNSGHQFGDHLSEQQRTVLIEYLKTL